MGLHHNYVFEKNDREIKLLHLTHPRRIRYCGNTEVLTALFGYVIMSKNEKDAPSGSGIRSMRSTALFRAVNFELYAKPNIVIMSIGLTCFGLCVGYIAYMRQKYESMGYYAAVMEDGQELFEKKKSKWN